MSLVEHAFMDCETFRQKGQEKHGFSPWSDNLGYLKDKSGRYKELAPEVQYLCRHFRSEAATSRKHIPKAFPKIWQFWKHQDVKLNLHVQHDTWHKRNDWWSQSRRWMQYMKYGHTVTPFFWGRVVPQLKFRFFKRGDIWEQCFTVFLVCFFCKRAHGSLQLSLVITGWLIFFSLKQVFRAWKTGTSYFRHPIMMLHYDLRLFHHGHSLHSAWHSLAPLNIGTIASLHWRRCGCGAANHRFLTGMLSDLLVPKEQMWKWWVCKNFLIF